MPILAVSNSQVACQAASFSGLSGIWRRHALWNNAAYVGRWQTRRQSAQRRRRQSSGVEVDHAPCCHINQSTTANHRHPRLGLI